ncbi:hypothetical protein [Undibacterium terreum]|uniref:Uncharacterized protein n=1 Tax=Undibacterium terreum TaxID=1224302 RepID=A0A916U8S4_9BURK|nr:hypothetical protein [Undibacterium terreum]GGC63681.1 hypothetical protein GCM10011396_08340 [Undibacterium terreum]
MHTASSASMDSPASSLSAARAGRAVGAMFFSIFGGAWLVLWSNATFGVQAVPLALIATVSLGLFLFAWLQYRKNRAALAAESETPERKRASRIFNFVNAGQWILIFISSNVLINMGLSAWVIPAAIFIVGLHFLPLAQVFNNLPHYLTGAALMLVAVAYPFATAAGPSSPLGCLGAGLILWASAAWAVRPLSVRAVNIE